MKPVVFSKRFEKAYVKRIRANFKLNTAYAERYFMFCSGIRESPLDDHALSGNMKGLRSFSVTGDVRVVYRETAKAYEFIDIGTHNQVYG